MHARYLRFDFHFTPTKQSWKCTGVNRFVWQRDLNSLPSQQERRRRFNNNLIQNFLWSLLPSVRLEISWLELTIQFTSWWKIIHACTIIMKSQTSLYQTTIIIWEATWSTRNCFYVSKIILFISQPFPL